MLRLSKQILGFCFLLCVGGSVEEVAQQRRRVPAAPYRHLDEDYNLDLSSATAVHKNPDSDLKPDPYHGDTRRRSEGLQLTTFVAERSDDIIVPAPAPPPRQTKILHYHEQEQQERVQKNRIQIRAGIGIIVASLYLCSEFVAKFEKCFSSLSTEFITWTINKYKL